MPKYLMLDHGGVLDGEFTEGNPGPDDLLLQDNEWGKQILKNGKQIVNDLNVLVNKYGYLIVFHSKNKEADQIAILDQLHNACSKKGIKFPSVYAMAVRDENKFVNLSPGNASIDMINARYGIKIAGYSIEGDGKSCVRTALAKLLGITATADHIVFDDGLPIIQKAVAEGYQAYLIGNGENNSKSLACAIHEVLNAAVKENNNALAVVKDSLSAKAYDDLPLVFRQFLSESTQPQRHDMSHVSTQAYWDGILSVANREALQKEFFDKADLPATMYVLVKSNNGLFIKPYRQMDEEFRKFIAKHTLAKRQVLGGISTEEYWSNLDKDQQQDLLKQYTELVQRSAPKSQAENESRCVIS